MADEVGVGLPVAVALGDGVSLLLGVGEDVHVADGVAVGDGVNVVEGEGVAEGDAETVALGDGVGEAEADGVGTRGFIKLAQKGEIDYFLATHFH